MPRPPYFLGEDDSFRVLGSFTIDESDEDLFNFYNDFFLGEWEGGGKVGKFREETGLGDIDFGSGGESYC